MSTLEVIFDKKGTVPDVSKIRHDHTNCESIQKLEPLPDNWPYLKLSSQEQVIDLENKALSEFFMTKQEWSEWHQLAKKRKHKVYRIWQCLWCGKELSFVVSNKDGKSKDYCEFMCNKRYAYFTARLAGLVGPKNHDSPVVKQYIDYCRVQLIFRTPAVTLNEGLKYVVKKSALPQPLIRVGKRRK